MDNTLTLTHEKKRSIRADLKTAIWLGPQLELVITRQSKATGLSEGIGKSDSTPVFFNESASVAQGLLRTTLLKWCPQCECRSPESQCENPRVLYVLANKGTLSNIAIWLLQRVHRLDDEAAAADIEASVRLAMEAVDSPPNRIYLGHCPCGRALYGDPDKVEVECDSCLALLRVAILRAANQERGRELFVTATQAARYLGEVYGVQITEHRISVWNSRNKLPRYPTTTTQRMYRLGDILDLAMAGNATRNSEM